MNFDSSYYPFPSKRTLGAARDGMVCTSQPLAAQAGLDMVKQGGNAVDAALAAAICLTVVEPTSNGIGGDAFALVWMKDRLYGLNASGPAPEALTIEAVKAGGHSEMPAYGWLPVTVPGAPKGWAALSKKFGALPFERLFEPAIRYAEEGFPISPTLGTSWAKTALLRQEGELYEEWRNTFTHQGRPPRIGEMWRSPNHARTLRDIADTKSDSFYTGRLAEEIDAASRRQGGFLRLSDLAKYDVEWVEPIGLDYRGYRVWEIPPNGQGLNALMALQMLQCLETEEAPAAEIVHQQIEAMKLAFADGMKYITDPAHMRVSVNDLLSESYARERSKLISEHAAAPRSGQPKAGGTVYLAAADRDGNMVSFIQSNYRGFGSGVVVPGTGIALQNRGCDFSLHPEDANALLPGKKSYHTIIPGFLTKDGKPIGPFGVMGGYMQPQGHMQLVMNILDFKLNPQAALDAPRWMWVRDKTVRLEPHFPKDIATALERKGHRIEYADEIGFGRGQMIWRTEDGVLLGATDSRADGMVAAW